jgi:ADP-heptose:LPS heptosyltransferase
MPKKKLLLIGYRAWGDWIYASPVIPILTEKYDVYFEINRKGYSLFHDDPRFKKIAVYTEFESQTRDKYEEMFKKRWDEMRELVKPDLEINLNGTCEVECIGETFQDQFYLPVGQRRAHYGKTGFYDAVLKRCGIERPKNFNLQGLHFWPDQEEHVQKWREKYKDNFVVVIPIAGSTAQKIFHNFRDLTDAILAKYPDAVIYMAGDQTCDPLVPQHERVKSMCGDRVDFKQAVHMMKYADMVIGPETGLLAAAGMWGTPKVILATTSSIWQMTQYQENDFSIQAPIHCSPCHRAIYFEDDCESPLRKQDGSWGATACSTMFRVEDIMQRVDHVYKNLKWGQRNGK